MQRLIGQLKLPPDGVKLLGGTMVTTIGNGMQTLTVAKILYDQTGSAAAFGWVIILEQVIGLLMQVVAGPFIDRGDPRRKCIQAELARGSIVCLASLMMAHGHFVSWVILMTLAIRLGQPFYKAAMFSITPAVMPGQSLERYNSYSNVCLQAGQLVGVTLAAPIIVRLGASIAFFINGLTFIFSALTIMAVSVPHHMDEENGERQSPWRSLVAGWVEVAQIIRRDAGMIWHLVLSTADSIAVFVFNVLEVPIVAARFHDSAYWLSVMGIVYALAAMAASAVITPLTTRLGSRHAAMIGIAGQMFCFALLAVTQSQVWTTVFITLMGAFNTISWTVLMTTLQLRAGKKTKARVGMVRSLLTALLTMALVPLISWLQAGSLKLALLGCAAICLIFSVIVLAFGNPKSYGRRLLGESGEPSAAVSSAA